MRHTLEVKGRVEVVNQMLAEALATRRTYLLTGNDSDLNANRKIRENLPVTSPSPDFSMNWIPFNPDWEISTEPAPSAKTEPAKAETPDVFGAKVIIAEDDPVSRELVCALLKQWGLEPLVTRDGHQALEALRAQRGATLAVLDWMMPGITAWRFAAASAASKTNSFTFCSSRLAPPKNSSWKLFKLGSTIT